MKTDSPLSKMLQYLPVMLLFLLISLAVIAKAIFLDNCMAYDVQDDLNHAFTGLSIAKSLLSKGSMPFFNYYNNFGTPLMGDALTYPLALHAIPYYLTDIANYPLVMTINRFVICFATMFSLMLFYRTFNIGIVSSAVASIFVFFNFGFFWHFAHHHYQMTVLFCTWIFLAQRVCITRHKPAYLFFSVTLLSGMMLYSVSANLIFLSFIFFLIHPLMYGRSWKLFAVNAGGLLAGSLVGGVQVVTTILAMMDSSRAGVNYADAFKIDFNAFTLMLRAFFQTSPAGVEVNRHIYFAVYFPLSCAVMAIVGTVQLRAKERPAFNAALVLGMIAVAVTWVLLANSNLWGSVPFIRSTDITRLLWIAYIFVGIGIGTFSDSLCAATLSAKKSWLMLLPLLAAACVSGKLSSGPMVNPLILPGYVAACIVVIINIARASLHGVGSVSCRWGGGIGGAMMTFMMLTCLPVIYHLGNWGNPKQCVSVNHFSDMPAFSPNLGGVIRGLDAAGRFAVNLDSNSGLELVSETFHRHGGGGRSIAMDGKLLQALTAKGVITVDDELGGYHFSNPWALPVADRLGLRYFFDVQNDDHEGWEKVGPWGYLFLYENTHYPSLVQAEHGGRRYFLNSFLTAGNDFVVHIPAAMAGSRIRITVTARPGFVVYVDGRRHRYGIDDYNFFFVDTRPGDRMIRLSYRPFASILQRLVP